MRIAGNDAFAPNETEEETQHDLANTVALGLVELHDLLEPEAIDVLRDQHASRREVRVHAWHPDMRVVPEQPRESALVLRLDLVVELIGDALAHLAQQRSRIATRCQAAEDRAHEADRAQLTGDRVCDTRVLHLHRDALAVARAGAVDLTEGGDREWVRLENSEHVLHAGVEILLDHPSHPAQRKRL